ncbi:hypothetical protein PHISP_05844 [Aspergillus sp. HF37]|nr:hypothetical protein PHISP_05844 [Aspergillus sp. HF37]
MSPWIYALRAVQLVFAIVVLGLTAHVVSWDPWRSTVDFMLFNGIWSTFLATPFLTLAPVYFSAIGHRFLVLAVEVLTMIFWFAGFIALAASLPPTRACHWIVCSELQAATVFGAFEWALFTCTTILALLGVLPSRRDSTGRSGGGQRE